MQRHRVNQIDFIGKERCHARAIIANRLKHHIGDVAFNLSPVVSVAHQNSSHAGLAFAQAVRTCSIGLEGGGIFSTFASVHRLDCTVGLGPGTVHDVNGGQQIWQYRVGRPGFHFDGVGVDLAHRADGTQIAAHVRALAARTVNGEHHILGAQGLTIMKFHTLAQFKAPHRWLGDAPLLRQRRHQLQLLIVGHQSFIDVAGESKLDGLCQRMRVHRQSITLIGHAQRRGMDGREKAECDDAKREATEFHGVQS